MKLLISSHAFLPSVGGVEYVSALLAQEFARKGHDIALVTQTASSEKLELPCTVIRRPTASELLHLVRWCDIYWQNHISLRTAWPLLLLRRPWVITYEGWIPRSGPGGWRGRLKHHFGRKATGIAISTAVAAHIRTPCAVIAPPYDDSVFRQLPRVAKDGELVFCGRLVPEKGADVLLKALSILKRDRLRPHLTIIGSGPEERKLKLMVDDLELTGQVFFAGVKTGVELAACLNAHRITVVPSLWREPFGVVALEGIACGCVVVGSEGGGLKDAIGPCGITFPNGDANALASGLKHLLSSPGSLERYRANAARHLSSRTRAAVADKYLRVFAAALDRKAPHFIPAAEKSAVSEYLRH